MLPLPKTPQKLFLEMRRAILGATAFEELVYEDVPPSDGSMIVTSLDVDPDIERIHPKYVS